MGSDSDVDDGRPSVIDAMQSCEQNSSAKDDSSGHNMRLLSEGYSPGPHDVLCGRGRKCFNHPGNVKFRSIVQSYLPQYSRSSAKLEKSYILSDVVDQVRKNSGEGGFIKKDPDTGRWYEVGDFLAREKTSQAFRDVLHDKYKSSNTAKKKRRQEDQAEKLFRAHSNRSLGASSLDASSVHSVGSSTTGDYMLSDSKLMRMERGADNGGVDVGFDNEDEFGEEDDLLGGLDHGGSNHSRSSNPNGHQFGGGGGGGGGGPTTPSDFIRQRSLRSVLDFDTNRRAVLAKAGDPTAAYARSSCPNLFAPPQRSNSGSMPPISQIEIIHEEAAQGRRRQKSRHFQDPLGGGGFDGGGGGGGADMDSFGTAATQETTATTGSGDGGGPQLWLHHSQPNLFGDAPPVNPQGGQRPQFARQPPNRLNRHHGGPKRVNSGGLAIVQQQIGNLGLNDSNHGRRGGGGLDGSNHSSSYPQVITSQGNGGDFQRNLGKSLSGSQGNGGDFQRNLGGSLNGSQGNGGDFQRNLGRSLNGSQGNGGDFHGSQGNGGDFQRNLGRSMSGSQRNVYDSNNLDEDDVVNNFMPQGLHQAKSHPGALLGDLNAASRSMNAGNMNAGNNNMGVTNNGNGVLVQPQKSLGGGGGDDLLARMLALDDTGFDMDVIDENPFEPVPLREG